MKDLIIIDGALKLENNDLAIGDSDQQQQERLLLTEKGNVKQYPDAGVGLLGFIENENPAALLREISTQFTADGMNVMEIKFGPDGTILINAPYAGS